MRRLKFLHVCCLLVPMFAAGTLNGQQVNGVTCIANAGVPPTVRSEGLTELVGDIVLNCTGGSPTPSGSQIPQANITIFLNTNVTSRILTNGFSEAALLIDEPINPILCKTPTSGCTATAGTATAPNVFPGILAGNSVSFLNVPIDPPGSTGTRELTIINVRANAPRVVESGQITPSVEITQGGNTQTVTIPPIAAQQGLKGSISLAGAGTNSIPFFLPNTTVNGTVHMEEGFTNAWDLHLGHPISVLPGAGDDGGTRLGVTFWGPLNSTLVFPTVLQSPWVFLNLAANTSGAFVGAVANGTLNGAAAFQGTLDPFGTSAQTGTMTLNWYGSGRNNFDPVPAGQVRSVDIPFTTLVPASGTAANFQGYMIAVCNFQYAHGFAFVSDVGARNLALGYLGIILDQPIGQASATAGQRSPLQPFASDGAAAAATLPVVTTVNSASYAGFMAVAPDSLVSGFGNSIALSTDTAKALPLPTTLAGMSLRITDSAGSQTNVGLLYAGATQVNYVVPSGVAPGVAVAEAISTSGTVLASGALDIVAVAPGIYSANASGRGVAAATALLVPASGARTTVDVFQLDAGTNKFIVAPLDLTVSGQQVYLTLYGTGFRNVGSQSNVSCQIGGVSVPVLYAGAQGTFVGLDQLNLGPVPVQLAGRGEVAVACWFDGAPSNLVTVAFK